MHQTARTLLLVILGMILGGAIFMLGSRSNWQRETRVIVDNAPLNRDTRMTTSFGPLLTRVAPSVVNIYSTRRVSSGRNSEMHPFLDDPLFRRFFRDPSQRERYTQNLGSGVIVSGDGYILTNFHVVEGAEEIHVAFANSTRIVPAKLIGTDPQTDLAVIKIKETDLPILTLADSDLIEVGDVVLAIGNPFGVGQTVTMGIVSGLGRSFGLIDYEDFIQTDASINPGNSGGALVDAEGRLIGINTAIVSGTGVNLGIGFAVPMNMARAVMEQILLHGKVVRGFLGIQMQPITPELAAKMKITSQGGVLVEGVVPNTPAANAGFRKGDVIVEFQGKEVADPRQLRLMVSQTRPESKVNFRVIRDQAEQMVQATLGELPGQEEQVALARRSPAGASQLFEGVEIAPLNSAARRQFEIPSAVQGVVVVQVEPGSRAYTDGLRAGQVIAEINHQAVANPKTAIAAMEQAEGDRILLRIWSLGSSRFIVLNRGGQ
jgi:serine protease Do